MRKRDRKKFIESVEHFQRRAKEKGITLREVLKMQGLSEDEIEKTLRRHKEYKKESF